tara:strand:- start:230 stop:478 length:249 start_codon:yes stop_codon:yes gene_type:complete
MKIHLYLPKEQDQCVMSLRLLHICKSIDKKMNEVRVYIKGLDFHDEKEHELPFVLLNDKRKSFDNFWNEVMGEKKLDNGDIL